MKNSSLSLLSKLHLIFSLKYGEDVTNLKLCEVNESCRVKEGDRLISNPYLIELLFKEASEGIVDSYENIKGLDNICTLIAMELKNEDWYDNKLMRELIHLSEKDTDILNKVLTRILETCKVNIKFGEKDVKDIPEEETDLVRIEEEKGKTGTDQDVDNLRRKRLMQLILLSNMKNYPLIWMLLSTSNVKSDPMLPYYIYLMMNKEKNDPKEDLLKTVSLKMKPNDDLHRNMDFIINEIRFTMRELLDEMNRYIF